MLSCRTSCIGYAKTNAWTTPSKTRSVIPLDFFNLEYKVFPDKSWTQEYYDLREAIQQGEAHFLSYASSLAVKLTPSVN